MGETLLSSEQVVSIHEKQEVEVVGHMENKESLDLGAHKSSQMESYVHTNVDADDSGKDGVFRKSYVTSARRTRRQRTSSFLPSDGFLVESSNKSVDSSTDSSKRERDLTSSPTPASPQLSPTSSMDFTDVTSNMTPYVRGDDSNGEEHSVPELLRTLSATTDMLKATQKEYFTEKAIVRQKKKNMLKLARQLSVVIQTLEEKEKEIEQLRSRLENLEQKGKEDEEMGQNPKPDEVLDRERKLEEGEKEREETLLEVVTINSHESPTERSTSEGTKQHVVTSQGSHYMRYVAIGACVVLIPSLTYGCRSQSFRLGSSVGLKEVIKAFSGGNAKKSE